MTRAFFRQLLTSGCCMAACGAFTIAGAGIAVSPLKQEIIVKPGEVGKAVISVVNNDREKTGQTHGIHAQILDVKATEEGALQFLPVGSIGTSAAKWITPTEKQLVLAPDQGERIELKIAPPLSTPPGEYYAALMISGDIPEKPDTVVAIQYRTASGIFVTIPGRTFPKEAKIERCELVWPESAAAPATQSGEAQPAVNPLPKVTVVLHNTGHARFEASGKARIFDSASREVFAAPLTTKRAAIYGGDTRLFEAALVKPLRAGKYTIKTEMDYQSTWGKARYTKYIEILPDQAEAMTAMSKRYKEGQAPVDVVPAKVVVTGRPGATRSVAFAVRNVGDDLLRGTAAVGPAQDSAAGQWIEAAPREFAVGKGRQRTVALRVQIPAGAAGGTYASAVILKVGSEGSPPLERVVPVEIEVKAEK